jgi:single-strand DNA-binding protein
MSINISVLTGRLTADVELKTTPSGVSVCSFSLAVDRKYQPQGEERATDFIDCVAWRKTAEFISKYFNKGSMIGIEGEIQTRTYTDKEGKKRKVTEVIVNNASFCGSKSESNVSNTIPQQNGNDPLAQISANLEQADFTGVDNDNDLPF